MMSFFRSIPRFARLGLVVALLAPGLALYAQEEDSGGGALGAKETVLRVLQLSNELEELLASLPAETQEELRGLLIDRLSVSAEALDQKAESEAQATTESAKTEAPGIASQPAPEPDLAVAREPAGLESAEIESARTQDVGIEPRALEEHAVEPGAVEPRTAETGTAEAIAEPPINEPAAPAESSRAQTSTRPLPPPTPELAPPPARSGCQTLVPFDSDGDGKLTGFDRYWRHFYLWTDVDEDRSVDEKEVESPYERGIREIEVSLRTFVRGKGKRKRSLEIQTERHILLDVGGDGWSGAEPRGDDGALAVDATAVREAGGPDLRNARGKAIEGIRPFKPGWIMRLGDGSEIVANCPKD